MRPPSLASASGLFSAGKLVLAPILLLSSYATRLLGHALARRSQTCHRVLLNTARHASP